MRGSVRCQVHTGECGARHMCVVTWTVAECAKCCLHSLRTHSRRVRGHPGLGAGPGHRALRPSPHRPLLTFVTSVEERGKDGTLGRRWRPQGTEGAALWLRGLPAALRCPSLWAGLVGTGAWPLAGCDGDGLPAGVSDFMVRLRVTSATRPSRPSPSHKGSAVPCGHPVPGSRDHRPRAS